MKIRIDYSLTENDTSDIFVAHFISSELGYNGVVEKANNITEKELREIIRDEIYVSGVIGSVKSVYDNELDYLSDKVKQIFIKRNFK